ncbi:hypothetical protein [Streptomyces olivaceoviridis]
MGPANAAYQTALDTQRRYQAIAAPVRALQNDPSDIYDWHRQINDVVRSVSLPRKLLDQLAATAALFRPANLSGLGTRTPVSRRTWSSPSCAASPTVSTPTPMRLVS